MLRTIALATVCALVYVVIPTVSSNKHRTCINSTNPDFGRMCMQVLGQSGKVVLGFPNSTEDDDPRSGDQWLQVRYRNLTEMNENATTVGKSGPKDQKHSFSSFASLDFEISELQEVDVDGVATLKFNMTANIPTAESKCKMRSDFFVFTENGTDVDLGGNGTVDVQAGDIKWNIGFDDWSWCDAGDQNCREGDEYEDGAMLMMNMELSGPNGSLALTPGSEASTGGSGNTQPCSGPAAQNNPFCQGGGSDIVDADFGSRRIGLVLEDTVRYGDSESRVFDAWEKMRSGYPEIYDMQDDEGEDNDVLGINLVFERRASKTGMEYDPYARQLDPIVEEEAQDWMPSTATTHHSAITTALFITGIINYLLL